MREFKIKNDKLHLYNGVEIPVFPKYTTQLLNLVNGTAQATRPAVVGQLSDLFPAYVEEARKKGELVTLEGWKKWYLDRYSAVIEESTRKIALMMQQYRRAMDQIDNEMIRDWVEDLVITKTFTGMFFQEVIIKFLGEVDHKPSRLSTPEEESKGIDGYVGDNAYSIKPTTYKNESKHLMEVIDAYMVYYEKPKDKKELRIEVHDDD